MIDDQNKEFGLVARNHPTIDPGFALAVFKLETGNATSDVWLTQNNPAGITCGNDYCSYASPIDGYEALFSLLEVYTKGTDDFIGKRTTVNDIRSVWSQTEDSAIIVKIWNEILKKGD